MLVRADASAGEEPQASRRYSKGMERRQKNGTFCGALREGGGRQVLVSIDSPTFKTRRKNIFMILYWFISGFTKSCTFFFFGGGGGL